MPSQQAAAAPPAQAAAQQPAPPSAPDAKAPSTPSTASSEAKTTATAQPASLAGSSSAAAALPISGVPTVVDTGTLVVKGATVHLSGVEGEAGDMVQDLTRYIRGREVACTPADAGGAQYRCRIDNYDLGEAILLNGGGRAAADAPERLRTAEERARTAKRGIWRR
jgi:endonuclease YncB( thermonuclease family)